MKYRFTIGRRIGLGFAILVSLTVVAFTLTIFTIIESKNKTETMVGQVTPSLTELKELNLMLQRSHTNISKWVYNKSMNDMQFRDELNKIISDEYPQKRGLLVDYSKYWTDSEKAQLQVIFQKIDSLFHGYKNNIMEPLNSLETYNDDGVIFLAVNDYEESETYIKTIYLKLRELTILKKEFADNVKKEMFESLDFLKRSVQFLSVLLMLGGVIIGIMTTQSQ
jgi:hypothetical protein